MIPPRFILILALAFPARGTSAAADYYVDAVAGADANAGTTPASAWKTLAKVNASQHLLKPGDRVLLRRGQVFAGPLLLETSGTAEQPITYASYGDGPKPDVTGFTVATGWKPLGKGIWKAACPACAAPVNMLTINGIPRGMGRFPNADAPNGGYLSVDSHVGKTSITDAALPDSPDWEGAEVVIRKYRWIIDRNRVTRHEKNTLTYQSGSVYEGVDRHGYFLQNDPRTLDAFGEWYFDPATRTVQVFFGDLDPAKLTVKLAAVDGLVAAGRRRDLVFSGLRFTGANQAALSVESSEGITVRDCEFQASGRDAIRGDAVNRFLLEDTTIEDTNNNGIAFHGGVSNSVLRRVTLKRTGMIAGMGASGDGSYNAITLLAGHDNLLEAFTIVDTGYIPVHFGGSRITVQNGFIDGFASVKDDSGGIYTWTGTADATPSTDRKVVGNVILRSRGASAGAEGEAKGFGIYLDDCASGVEVRGNTVAHTSAGIFLHNAHHCRISGNTLFDNDVQLLIAHDDITPKASGEIREIAFHENTLVSRTPEQLVLYAKSVSDDFARFGTFERNVYARPADPDMIVRQEVKDAVPQAYDLAGRRAVTGLEAGTRPAAVKTAARAVQAKGPNLVANGDFAKDLNGASCWSRPGNCKVAWTQGKLDGGALGHAYVKPSGTSNPTLVMTAAGALAAGKTYELRFSILGSAEHGSAGVRLRDGEKPWGGLTEYQYVKVDASRRECAVLLTAPSDRPASMVEWAFNERDGGLWLDNVSLREAAVVEPDPKIFRLEYNLSPQPRTVVLNEEWVDLDGHRVPATLVLPPRASAVLVRKDACIGLK